MSGLVRNNREEAQAAAEADELRSLLSEELSAAGYSSEQRNPTSPAAIRDKSRSPQPPSAKRTQATPRGRPKRFMEKRDCNLCGCNDCDPDPVDLQLLKAAQPESDEEQLKTQAKRMRWAYQAVNGVTQGNLDWYCVKVVEVRYIGKSCKELRALISSDSAEMALFLRRREQVIEISAQHEGNATLTVFKRAEDVVVTTQASMHHKRHGRCVSVRKFTKETGHAPLPRQIHKRRNRKGDVVEYVKIYDRRDSEEWSFTEDDAEIVQKRRKLDDGAVVLDDAQLQECFDAAGKVLIGDGDAKHQRTSKADYAQMLDASREMRGEAAPPSLSDEIAKCEGKSSGREAIAGDVAESRSALHRALGVHEVESTPRNQTAGKIQKGAKGKAKAKAKTAGRASKSIAGRALGKHKETIQCMMKEAREYMHAVLSSRCSGDLKDLEKTGKDLSKRFHSKEDLVLDMDSETMDDTLGDFHSLASFCTQSTQVLKSWKAFAHTMSEKNRLLLESHWTEFKALLDQRAPSPELPSHEPLVLAVITDLAKGSVLRQLNKEDWRQAVATVTMDVLVRNRGLSNVDAAKLQKVYIVDTCKKLARKHHKDAAACAEAWLSTMAATGVIGDPSFKETLDHFSDVFECVDAGKIQEGLDFIEAHRSIDAFVKSIAIVASRNLARAAAARKGHRDRRVAEMRQLGIRGQLQEMVAALEDATTLPVPYRQHLQDLREHVLVLDAECSKVAALEISRHFLTAWQDVYRVFDAHEHLHFTPGFRDIIQAVSTGFSLSSNSKEFSTLMSADAWDLCTKLSEDLAHQSDIVRVAVTTTLEKPSFVGVKQELEKVPRSVEARLRFYTAFLRGLNLLGESEEMDASPMALRIASLLKVLSELETSTLDQDAEISQHKRVIEEYLARCHKYARAWAIDLVRPSQESFEGLLFPDMPVDRLFHKAPGDELIGDELVADGQSQTVLESRQRRSSFFAPLAQQNEDIEVRQRAYSRLACLVHGQESDAVCALAEWDFRLQVARARLALLVVSNARLDIGEKVAECAQDVARLSSEYAELSSAGQGMVVTAEDGADSKKHELQNIADKIVKAINQPSVLKVPCDMNKLFDSADDAVKDLNEASQVVEAAHAKGVARAERFGQVAPHVNTIVEAAREMVAKERLAACKQITAGLHIAVGFAAPHRQHCDSLFEAGQEAMKACVNGATNSALPYMIVKLTRLAKYGRSMAKQFEHTEGADDLENQCRLVDDTSNIMQVFLGLCHAVTVLFEVVPRTAPASVSSIKEKAVAKIKSSGVLADLPQGMLDLLEA